MQQQIVIAAQSSRQVGDGVTMQCQFIAGRVGVARGRRVDIVSARALLGEDNDVRAGAVAL